MILLSSVSPIDLFIFNMCKNLLMPDISLWVEPLPIREVRRAIVFRVADKQLVQSFAELDPYVINGLVTDWRIQEWNVVIGNF